MGTVPCPRQMHLYIRWPLQFLYVDCNLLPLCLSRWCAGTGPMVTSCLLTLSCRGTGSGYIDPSKYLTLGPATGDVNLYDLRGSQSYPPPTGITPKALGRLPIPQYGRFLLASLVWGEVGLSAEPYTTCNIFFQRESSHDSLLSLHTFLSLSYS